MELYSFDDDYVRRLREGDRWTEAHFLRYFGDLMLVKLRGRVRTMSRLEDIRQEVFLRIVQASASREGKKVSCSLHPKTAGMAARQPGRTGATNRGRGACFRSKCLDSRFRAPLCYLQAA